MTSPGSGSVMTPSGKVCVSGRAFMVVFRVEAEASFRGLVFCAVRGVSSQRCVRGREY